MAAAVAERNGHGGGAPPHSGGDSIPHGGEDSGGASGESPHKSFARRPNYKPTDPVQVRITAALRDEFDDWYAGQYPGVKQPPSRDPWIEEVFRLGLERIRELMPPQLSPQERLRQAREAGQ